MEFEGVKLSYGIILVVIILLLIFGSTDLEGLTSAP
jgi:Sec-independent protein translocase protein TatA